MACFDESVWDGVSGLESEGFFDELDTPPWDTWVCWAEGDFTHAPHTVFILAWVPPSYVDRVNHGMGCNPVECIWWADQYRQFRLDIPFMRELDTAGLLSAASPKA